MALSANISAARIERLLYLLFSINIWEPPAINGTELLRLGQARGSIRESYGSESHSLIIHGILSAVNCRLLQ